VEQQDEPPAVRGWQQAVGLARTDPPPGEFVSQRLLDDCERFLRETRRMSEARENMITGLAGLRFR
jgi:hypothetical protein